MGQIIKKLETINDLGKGVETELNDAIYGNERIIHFHFKNMRYEMSLSDYLTVLSGIIVAEKSLEILKK